MAEAMKSMARTAIASLVPGVNPIGEVTLDQSEIWQAVVEAAARKAGYRGAPEGIQIKVTLPGEAGAVLLGECVRVRLYDGYPVAVVSRPREIGREPSPVSSGDEVPF